MSLTDDDKTRLRAIFAEADGERLAGLIYAYYRDADRADRTDRGTLYLHLGMLAGVILRLKKADATVGWGDTREKAPR